MKKKLLRSNEDSASRTQESIQKGPHSSDNPTAEAQSTVSSEIVEASTTKSLSNSISDKRITENMLDGDYLTPEPGISIDEVLEAYTENSEPIQELKTQCFTSPIPWNNALKFPNKTIAVEA
ncbi:3554_t:CDS:2 [Entrophospora sp. SA101]|nr:3554_t:CDS:2 [Entrophospora sp. SA101]